MKEATLVTKVFVVRGYTGEYEDYREWPVKAFTEKSDAENFMLLLKKEIADRGFDNREEFDRPDGREDFKHPLDADCCIDYTGAGYRIEEVKL